MEAREKEVLAGTALYTKFVLHFYDWWALKISCRLIWKCPSQNMLALYNECVSSNHLDVGPGTGYFLDKCKFPDSHPRVVLMDLNPNCLQSAAGRLNHYRPEVYRLNALEPVAMKIKPFDSVAIMNVLHCMPGTMKSKTMVFEHFKNVLNIGGSIFGSTILGKDIPQSYLARRFLRYCNSKRYMTNYQDDYDSLKQGLDEHFQKTSIKVIGSMALFSAQK